MKIKIKFTVAMRLLIGFSAVGLGVIAITVISLIAMDQIKSRIDVVVDDVAPAVNNVGDQLTEMNHLARWAVLFFNEETLANLDALEDEYEVEKGKYLEQQTALQGKMGKFPELVDSAEKVNSVASSMEFFFDNIETFKTFYRTSLESYDSIKDRRQDVRALSDELIVALDRFIDDSYDPSISEVAYGTKSVVQNAIRIAIEATYASSSRDANALKDEFQAFADDYITWTVRMDELTDMDPITSGNIELITELVLEMKDIVTGQGGVIDVVNKYLQIKMLLDIELDFIFQTLDDGIEELLLVEEAFTELSVQASGQANQTRANAVNVLAAAALVVVALSAIIGIVVVRSIRKPLHELRQFILRVGNGDLTKTIGKYSADEIGDISRAMDQLVGQVREVVSEIARQSDLVNEVSSKTSDLADVTSEKSKQQQSEIDQSIYSVNEMSESIKEVARTTEQNSQDMQASESEAVKINGGIDMTVNSISELNVQMEKAVGVIQTLDKGVGSIESILETIQTIAEQTNLLALNAAIEAARAGEQGRGFAVVADEVRTLATRTQTSTEEIREQISTIQKQSNVAVEAISISQKSTQSVASTAETTGQQFGQFMNQIRGLSEANVSIAAAAEEQSTTTEEVTRLMKVVGELTKETNEITQQVADGTKSLNKVANDLQNAVNRFQT